MQSPERRLFKRSTHTESLFRETAGLGPSPPRLRENYDVESIRRHARRLIACERKSSGSFFEDQPEYVSGWLYYAPEGTFTDWEPAAVLWVSDDGHVALAAIDGGTRGTEMKEGASGLRPDEIGRRLVSLHGRPWSEAEFERLDLSRLE